MHGLRRQGCDESDHTPQCSVNSSVFSCFIENILLGPCLFLYSHLPKLYSVGFHNIVVILQPVAVAENDDFSTDEKVGKRRSSKSILFSLMSAQEEGRRI